MNQKNVKYLSLGTGDADIAAAGTLITKASDLAVGVLAVVLETNVTTVSAATGKKIRVVQRLGDDLIYSPVIDMNNIRGKRYSDGVAEVEQVSYVGYNGAAGALDAVVDSDYILKPIIKNTKTTYNNTPFITHWSYKSHDTTTSQYAIAAGLMQSFNSWKKRFASHVLDAGIINSEPVDATNDFLGDCTVVQGTNAFTSIESAATGDSAVYNAAAVLVVGDFVRIGGVGAGTTLTSHVYLVTAVATPSAASSIITLDRPILEASGTYAAATSDIEVIPAADIKNCGLAFVGVKLPVNAETRNHEKVRYEIALDGAFTDSVVTTYSVIASEGVGTKAQIGILERQVGMNDGQAWVQAYPSIQHREETAAIAEANFPFDQIIIEHYDDNFKPLLGDGALSYMSQIIATTNAAGYAKLKTIFGL